jgi:hypothetical protein
MEDWVAPFINVCCLFVFAFRGKSARCWSGMADLKMHAWDEMMGRERPGIFQKVAGVLFIFGSSFLNLKNDRDARPKYFFQKTDIT